MHLTFLQRSQYGPSCSLNCLVALFIRDLTVPSGIRIRSDISLYDKPSLTFNKYTVRNFIFKVIAAFEKAEAPLGFNAYKVEFGEGSYVLVSVADSPAQLYSQPGTPAVLIEALGPEAAQALFQEWRDCVTSYET